MGKRAAGITVYKATNKTQAIPSQPYCHCFMLSTMRILLLLPVLVVLCSANSSVLSLNNRDTDIQTRDASICDPHTASTNNYPGILTRIDVIKTSPIKLKAYLRLPSSNEVVTAEGYLSGYTFFNDLLALTACRSLNCSRLVGKQSSTYRAPGPQMCEFTCPDGSSAMQECRPMLNAEVLSCPTDAMSFVECKFKELWNTRSDLTGVLCNECGE